MADVTTNAAFGRLPQSPGKRCNRDEKRGGKPRLITLNVSAPLHLFDGRAKTRATKEIKCQTGDGLVIVHPVRHRREPQIIIIPMRIANGDSM
jgi:hypothetical protein